MYPQNSRQLSRTDGQMAGMIRWKRQLKFQNMKTICLITSAREETEVGVGEGVTTVAALDKGLVEEREHLEIVGSSVTHEEDPEVDFVVVDNTVARVLIGIRLEIKLLNICCINYITYL